MFIAFFPIFLLITLSSPLLNATEMPPESSSSALQPISPFTGKITRNKVRMRLQSNLDAPILYELNRDDLLDVVGEKDEFYAVLPPKDTKAYVFRTFVLDNIVEGNRVNVRLEPALESPVIGQLNNGDRIFGVVSPLNSKWLEISPPPSTRFFVCKEYVEKIGPPAMMAQIEKRRSEVNALLSSAHLISDSEWQKPYQEIHLEAAIANLNTIIKQYTDFPKSVEEAKTLLASIQDQYLLKKISYLEARALQAEKQIQSTSTFQTSQNLTRESVSTPSDYTPSEVFVEETFPENLESRQPLIDVKRMPSWATPFDPSAMTGTMSSWISTEKALYDSWNNNQGNSGSPKEFYEQQFSDSIRLKGTVEHYSRAIRNKPGDYILVSPLTNFPIAYLYSTHVDLHEAVGREVVLHASPRANNNFAFPAYYILSLE